MADMQEDLSASSAPVSGDMGDRRVPHTHVGGGEGVIMYVQVSCAHAWTHMYTARA